jgi:hypothetical protein
MKQRFEEILKEMQEIHDRKNKDYAGDDYLSNLKMCEAMGIPAWKGVVIRMTDKMARLMNLAKSEDPGTEESVRDTFLDMGIYSGMGLIAYEDSQGEAGTQDIGARRSRRQSQRRRKKSVVQPEEAPSEDASAKTD